MPAKKIAYRAIPFVKAKKRRIKTNEYIFSLMMYICVCVESCTKYLSILRKYSESSFRILAYTEAYPSPCRFEIPIETGRLPIEYSAPMPFASTEYPKTVRLPSVQTAESRTSWTDSISGRDCVQFWIIHCIQNGCELHVCLAIFSIRIRSKGPPSYIYPITASLWERRVSNNGRR